MTENLFITLILLHLVFFMRADSSGKLPMWIVAGMIFGGACLTRGMLFLFTPLLLLTVLIQSKRKGYELFSVFLGVAIVIVPWTVRNYIVHGALIPITTKGGYNLYIYTYPVERYDFNSRFDAILIPDMTGLSEVQREAKFRDLAIQNIKANSGLMVRFAAYKLVDFWRPLAERGSNIVRLAYMIELGSVFTLAIPGIVVGLRKKSHKRFIILLITLIAFHAMAAALFTGGGKARLPIEPLLLLLAGGGCVVLQTQFVACLKTRFNFRLPYDVESVDSDC